MKRVLLIAALFYGGICSAQDPHFSQYYASQTTVNPAASGLYEGDMRLSGLYRQQWPQFGSAFVTGTFAAEWKPQGFKDGQNINKLSLGGMMMYDKTPDEILKGQYIYGVIAYHKALDAEGKHRLGLGFMGGYNQRTIDASKLTFGSGFTGSGFTVGGEPIKSGKSGSFDIHSGLMYSYQTEDRLIYAGVSAYHLLTPKDYFMTSNSVLDNIPRRYNANAGFNLLGANGLRFAGSALFMQQAKVHEVIAGGAVGFPFSEDNGVIYTGAWYRLNESIIPSVNLQWKTINLGLSYDIFFSSNKTITKPKSFELSMAYRLIPYRSQTGCFVF